MASTIPSYVRALVIGFASPELRAAYSSLAYFARISEIQSDFELPARLSFVSLGPQVSQQLKERVRAAAKNGMAIYDSDSTQVLTNRLRQLAETPARPSTKQADMSSSTIVLVGFETTPAEHLLLRKDNVWTETNIQSPHHVPRGTGLVLVFGEASSERLIRIRRAFAHDNAAVRPCSNLQQAVTEINHLRGDRDNPLQLPTREEQPAIPKRNTDAEPTARAAHPVPIFQSPFTSEAKKAPPPATPAPRLPRDPDPLSSKANRPLILPATLSQVVAPTKPLEGTKSDLEKRLEKVKAVTSQPGTLGAAIQTHFTLEHLSMSPMAAATQLKPAIEKAAFKARVGSIYSTLRLILISAELWQWSVRNRSKRVRFSSGTPAPRPRGSPPPADPTTPPKDIQSLEELSRRRSNMIEDLKGHLNIKIEQTVRQDSEIAMLKAQLAEKTVENARLRTAIDQKASELSETKKDRSRLQAVLDKVRAATSELD